MSWIKKKYKKAIDEFKEGQEAANVAKQKARAVYFEQKEKERIRLARVKAQQEALAKERKIKARYAPRPKTSTGGFRGVASGISSGIASYNVMTPSYFAPPKPKTIPKIMPKTKKKSKKRSKKKTTRYIIRGGVAYPVG